MHKSVCSLLKPWWIGKGFIKPCFEFLELVKDNDLFFSFHFNKKHLVYQNPALFFS